MKQRHFITVTTHLLPSSERHSHGQRLAVQKKEESGRCVRMKNSTGHLMLANLSNYVLRTRANFYLIGQCISRPLSQVFLSKNTTCMKLQANLTQLAFMNEASHQLILWQSLWRSHLKPVRHLPPKEESFWSTALRAPQDGDGGGGAYYAPRSIHCLNIDLDGPPEI